MKCFCNFDWATDTYILKLNIYIIYTYIHKYIHTEHTVHTLIDNKKTGADPICEGDPYNQWDQNIARYVHFIHHPPMDRSVKQTAAHRQT